MIQSMTGFGEAQLEMDGLAFHVETRSVNNRYFKTSIRLPDELAFMEGELEQLIRRHVTRGSLTLRLHLRDLSEAAAQDINLAALRHYIGQLQPATAEIRNFTIDLATLAMLPGVCQPHEMNEAQRDRCVQATSQLAEKALVSLVEMRKKEGRALADDLRAHCTHVRELLASIRERVPNVIVEYRDRLLNRVRELIADSNVRLAEDDVLREVAVYADRSDISEEIARVDSHLRQFDECIGGRETAGRKLDFIAQELLREANTIGSKAGDAQIARHVIDMKSAIDRIKEQVQNVE